MNMVVGVDVEHFEEVALMALAYLPIALIVLILVGYGSYFSPIKIGKGQ